MSSRSERLSAFLIVFLFAVMSVYGDNAYSKVLSLEKEGRVSQALELCYKELRSNKNDAPDKILDCIFRMESNTGRILEIVASCGDRVQDKHRIYSQTAALALMCGSNETAQQYYDKVYLADPVPANLNSLYMSAVLLYEQGELESSLSKLNMIIAGNQQTLGQKAQVMAGAVQMSMGKKSEGTACLDKVLAAADCPEEVLFLVYDVASAFSMTDMKNKAVSRLKKDGFEGKLAASDNSIPATPSRIFISSDSVEKTTLVSKVGAVHKEDSSDRPAYIQTGSFSSLANAKNLADRIRGLGLEPEIQTTSSNGSQINKVIIRVTDTMDVNNVTIMLKDCGIPTYLVF